MYAQSSSGGRRDSATAAVDEERASFQSKISALQDELFDKEEAISDLSKDHVLPRDVYA